MSSRTKKLGRAATVGRSPAVLRHLQLVRLGQRIRERNERPDSHLSRDMSTVGPQKEATEGKA